ncbi:hypothetical protein DRP07_09850 [Archaeoglobales archaeon]|nr:MAG: hypothetical protein DRP07_09850 [Archaeoglobales archaeon]
MEEKIEAIFDSVAIPLKKLNIPEKSKITLRIEKTEKIDNLGFYSYTKLLREGEDAENLFEF